MSHSSPEKDHPMTPPFSCFQMPLRLLLAAGLAGALASACVDSRATGCTPATCTGCCRGDVCSSGMQDNACAQLADAGSSDGGTDVGASDGGSNDGGPTCTGGRTYCAGQCVDTTSDPRYCGGCGTPCNPGEVCQASSCKPSTGDCRQPGSACTGFSYCDLNVGQCKPGCATTRNATPPPRSATSPPMAACARRTICAAGVPAPRVRRQAWRQRPALERSAWSRAAPAATTFAQGSAPRTVR